MPSRCQQQTRSDHGLWPVSVTIGRWPEWSMTAARERAKELRRAIDKGQDPLAAALHLTH